jgi:hypothetical protein
VDRDLRASLLAACAAAALSALVGVIAGVGFLVLLLRALACGAAIGAATFGAIALFRQSVPGLMDRAAAQGPEAGIEPAVGPEMGSNVNIVLPGEAGEIGTLAEGPAPLASDAEPAEAVEDAEEADEPSLLESDEGTFDAEAAIPAETGRGAGKRASLGFDELDVLPDLDGFSDSFTASEFASGGQAAERSAAVAMPSSAAAASVPRTGQGNLDSAALAQAVRTILKRDQKG